MTLLDKKFLWYKWLTAEGKPKEYDEILNVAEDARSIQMGMRPTTVTGGNDCVAFASQGMEQPCACQRIPACQRISECPQVISTGQLAQKRTMTRKPGIES